MQARSGEIAGCDSAGFLAEGVRGLTQAASQHQQAMIWSASVFDDCSMWVSKGAFRRSFEEWEEVLERKMRRKGKNVQLQVLNVSERLFVATLPSSTVLQDSSIASVEVQSPAQVLTVANAPTLYDRWLRWTVLSAEPPGDAVDPARDLERALRPEQPLRRTPWRVIVMLKDLYHVEDQGCVCDLSNFKWLVACNSVHS